MNTIAPIGRSAVAPLPPHGGNTGIVPPWLRDEDDENPDGHAQAPVPVEEPAR